VSYEFEYWHVYKNSIIKRQNDAIVRQKGALALWVLAVLADAIIFL